MNEARFGLWDKFLNLIGDYIDVGVDFIYDVHAHLGGIVNDVFGMLADGTAAIGIEVSGNLLGEAVSGLPDAAAYL